MTQTFKRDKHSGALLSNDKSAVTIYKANRDRELRLRTDINTIKSELREIKLLLQQLISRG